MALDSQALALVSATVMTIGLFINAVVHWEKLRPVLLSHSAFVIAEYALLFGCFPFGFWAIVVGANVYLLLVFIDFIRRDDNSCCAVGSAIFAAAMGVFNFAMQFAIIINGR